MPDPYPDDARPRPAAGGDASHTAHRGRSAVPLLLALALTLVAVLAAMRGDGDAPTLASPTAVSETSPADGAGTDGAETASAIDAVPSPPDDQSDPADADADGDAGDGDAEVLGTTATPTPAPEPTPTVQVEDLPTSGSGEFVGAPGASEPIGAAPYRRFAVAVETDIGVDVLELAAFVDTVLSDERSWIGDGVTGFERVSSDQPVDFIIVVATPATVDRLCAPLQTAGRYSCAANGWVALNLHRWMTATPEWPASLDMYRHYLVNHEVGHYILGPDHPGCPEPGALAPIMMQQTIDLAGCRPNGWVFPRRS
ncbi:MAG: DUF3152 domain-containing protein [Acidimicrobiales bacterium]